jgi:hypothetical protein
LRLDALVSQPVGEGQHLVAVRLAVVAVADENNKHFFRHRSVVPAISLTISYTPVCRMARSRHARTHRHNLVAIGAYIALAWGEASFPVPPVSFPVQTAALPCSVAGISRKHQDCRGPGAKGRKNSLPAGNIRESAAQSRELPRELLDTSPLPK